MTRSLSALFALALLLPATSAWSLSYEDAAYNLSIIEGAKQDSEFCERTNPGSLELLRAWNREVATVRSNALDALRLKAKNSGLSGSDTDAFIDRAQNHIKDQVSAQVPQKAAMCKSLPRTLEHYKSLLRL
jgi:hypothetical protein